MLRIAIIMLLAAVAGAADKKQPTPLERYVEEASKENPEAQASPGSLYSPVARLADLGRDLRGTQTNDLVTILVSDRASAVAKGTTVSSRKSAANAGISAALGPVKTKGTLANLAGFESSQSLDGQGATTRETELTTTISARIAKVLPNGYLVIEGTKDVMVNSERQVVTVRGIARWNDVGAGNTIRSDRLAELEIRVQGKGVVSDAVRRPNILYRILLGILPI
jgi:flagellar L-ring protein precursor FlgH